jgi:hypothetical protein
MSATEALKEARAAGIHVNIDGDDLVLEAPAPPSPALLSLLKHHGASILALLQPKKDGWTAEDWHTLFEERAEIGEYKGGLSQHRAEANAFKACIATWLNQNLVISPDGLCVRCGAGDQPNDALLPYGTTPPGAAWLHGGCWPAWSRARQAQATDALAAMGIRPPADTNPRGRPIPSQEISNGPEAPPQRTVATEADGSGRGTVPTVRANQLKTNAGTAADGADANRPPQSAPGKAGAPRRRARL